MRHSQASGLAEPTQITVRSAAGEPFSRILDYDLGSKPVLYDPGSGEGEAVPVGALDDYKGGVPS